MDGALEELWKKLSLTSEEEDAVVADEEDEGVTTGEERLILICKLLTVRPFNAISFMTTMKSVWRPKKQLSMKPIGENLFICQFSHLSDVKRVWDGAPWHFDNNLVMLHEFEGRIQPSELIMNKAYFWVRFYNLPLGCMTRSMGEKLGSKVGSVIEVDNGDADMIWGRSLRVRVCLEVSKPLKRFIPLTLKGEHTPKRILNKYERLPTFCFYCGVLGHHMKDCQEEGLIERESEDINFQYGAWLRASPTRSGRPKEESNINNARWGKGSKESQNRSLEVSASDSSKVNSKEDMVASQASPKANESDTS